MVDNEVQAAGSRLRLFEVLAALFNLGFAIFTYQLISNYTPSIIEGTAIENSIGIYVTLYVLLLYAFFVLATNFYRSSRGIPINKFEKIGAILVLLVGVLALIIPFFIVLPDTAETLTRRLLYVLYVGVVIGVILHLVAPVDFLRNMLGD